MENSILITIIIAGVAALASIATVCVLIDTDYTGEHFRMVESYVPKKKTDFVEGKYTVSLQRPDARVAVKIIDMLGEYTIITE